MPQLTRRTLLASTAAVLAAPRLSFAAASGPPIAPVRPVTEVLWGEKITDRYRWMESQSPEWEAYVRAQGAYAAQTLAKIPGRSALAAAIAHNTGAVVAVVSVQTGGGKIFAEIRPAGAALSQLFVRDSLTAPNRLLIDPQTFATAASHAALDWWAPSPDGSHVVFGISTGGSEQSTLRILVTDTGALLPEGIDRTAEASPSWLPDGAALFYNRYQDVPPQSLAYEENSLCWLHRLGTDPASDVKIMGQSLSPSVKVQEIDFPTVTSTPGSPVVIGALASGVQNELSLYAAPLAAAAKGPPPWVNICAPADNVTAFAVQGESIYLLTHQHAPRYKILKTTAAAPGIAQAVEVVAQSASVIRAIAAARDALYILDLNAGLAGIRRLTPDGKITLIKLPFAGAISEGSFYAAAGHDGAWFILEGWVHPPVVCHLGPDGTVTTTSIAPPPPIDLSPYTSEEIFAPARDGTKIPLSLVYRKGLQRNGRAPLLLEAYGAYGITLDPAFLARWLPFLDLGGVFAVAHVRGGGELGEDWHIAGQKLKKFHSWEDTIDCARYLINTRWTSHKHLAVIGGSAGGITVGRLLTERPDLAAVVVSEVGVSDALRSEFSPNGPPNIPEFGSVTTQAGFLGLYAMDAYQHVHDHVKYPAVLLTTGLHDPRVAPWEPTKMTARLQAATASGNPVLLRVEDDAGHGIGSTRAQRDAQTADIIAFIMWRTGDPRFQPKS
ncbi:prolyl oligopeptidase [Acidocella aquatica]|uniref:prolyl oligopeptidase n=1 Tax=Acidocella aquatica TaxID=1922313 RepID=A0ABQ6A5W9_9PROT|nr:prolyl oligopeptidase family serine peptidase [Acidocella aquatica]GLR67043.1 prolyl oligopeptidase [Acidocella aquatica]